MGKLTRRWLTSRKRWRMRHRLLMSRRRLRCCYRLLMGKCRLRRKLKRKLRRKLRRRLRRKLSKRLLWKKKQKVHSRHQSQFSRWKIAFQTTKAAKKSLQWKLSKRLLTWLSGRIDWMRQEKNLCSRKYSWYLRAEPVSLLALRKTSPWSKIPRKETSFTSTFACSVWRILRVRRTLTLISAMLSQKLWSKMLHLSSRKEPRSSWTVLLKARSLV